MDREEVSGALIAMVLAVVAVVVVGVVVLVGWQVGWWFQAQNVNRADRVTQQGYANQTALQAQVGQEFSDIASLQRDEHVTPANTSFDQPSIIQDAKRICAQLPQFAPGYSVDASWRTWGHANCANGTLSAASALGK